MLDPYHEYVRRVAREYASALVNSRPMIDFEKDGARSGHGPAGVMVERGRVLLQRSETKCLVVACVAA